MAPSKAAARRRGAWDPDDGCRSGSGERGSEASGVRRSSVAFSVAAGAKAARRQARPGGGAQEGLGGQAEPGMVSQATEQRDAPVGALDSKMLHDVPAFINVRAAGDRDCSADLAEGTLP
mgnify:CR=1 FL=1